MSWVSLLILLLLASKVSSRRRERKYNLEYRHRDSGFDKDHVDPASILRDDERGQEMENLVRATKEAIAAVDDTFAPTIDSNELIPGPALNAPSKPRNTRRGESNANTDQSPSSHLNTAQEETYTCPVCPSPSHKIKLSHVKQAFNYFWREMYQDSFACACQALLLQPENTMAQALLHAINKDPKADIVMPVSITSPPTKDPAPLDLWQVLGPFPVGKLEVDADPAFDAHDRLAHDNATFHDHPHRSLDPAVHILTHTGHAWSELLVNGVVSWKTVRTAQGIAKVQFSAQWQDLAASLQTPTVYEFQAWARAETYVRESGVYMLSCQGVHSAYVRSGRSTRLLAGDVYMAGQFVAAVDLTIGPVGIVLPLRGVASAQFYCHLSQVVDKTSSIRVLQPRQLPHLLSFLRYSDMYCISKRTAFAAGLDNEWYHKENKAAGHGLLLLGLFAVPVTNTHTHPLSLSFKLDSSLGWQKYGEFSLRVASHHQEGSGRPHPPPVVAPGQTLAVPLEIYSEKAGDKLLPCAQSGSSFVAPKLRLSVTPSRGRSVAVEMQFECRRQNQSFLVSFLDHDGTVSQAAVILPLPTIEERSRWESAESTTHSENGQEASSSRSDSKSSRVCKDAAAGGDLCQQESFNRYPVLTTLHGTGIAPLSQADAYKVLDKTVGVYKFGVEGYFVLAPSRFGAHNWEAIGALTAASALRALARMLEKFPALPQVDWRAGIIAGHSMGAHGALVQASNSPSNFACMSATGLWITKESYSVANAFFQGDVQNSFSSPTLQAILAQSLSEFHTDRFAANMAQLRTHIRVGGGDATTHPYYSRRMARLLDREGASVTVEELKGKEHWWWDTNEENDGGVLNDKTMREFYRECLARRAIAACPLNTTWTLKAISPHSQAGRCGVAITQQVKSFAMSSISTYCHIVEHQPGMDNENGAATLTSDSSQPSLVCRLDTKNVRHVTLNINPTEFGLCNGTVNSTVNLVVDGVAVSTAQGSVVSICLQPSPHVCAPPPMERGPETYGPIRAIYSRPFIIIYGTPTNSLLRIALRDLAVYIGNAHYNAHSTYVLVISDLEYKSRNYGEQDLGLLLVGGPSVNKAARMIYDSSRRSSGTEGDDDEDPEAGPAEREESLLSRPTVHFPPASEDGSGANHSFSIAGIQYAAPSDAVIATFPLVYPRAMRGGQARLGIILHANSLEGYLHISRLAWSVVPPMVRAPFAAYLPDYIVIDQRIWAQGFGSVRTAGFWDYDWNGDETYGYREG